MSSSPTHLPRTLNPAIMGASIIEDPESTILPDDLDIDSFLAGFSADHVVGPDLWLPSQPLALDFESPELIVCHPAAESPRDSISLDLAEMEKLLMADEGAAEDRLEEGFVDGLFQSGSSEPDSDAASTGAETGPGSVGREMREDPVGVRSGKEDEDPISKRRRRQTRNRDSAMKSRERKKMYVKELEMKSKYLGTECSRLSYLLQCYVAENLALHQQLQQKERPIGAPIARQESAVLFAESLPLGSLFWLVSIVCLFLMPGLLIESPRIPSRPGRDVDRRVAELELGRRTVSNYGRPDPRSVAELVLMRRRCRGVKVRMKLSMSGLHV